MQKPIFLIAVAFLTLFHMTAASAQIITTVAGRGPYVQASALSVPIPGPRPIAVSKTTGSVYFAAASTVYRYDPVPGTITAVAGNGTYGYSGDGGPATSAQLKTVSGLALDKGGNLFILDYADNRVRKVTSAGAISTVAGNGIAGSTGDGGPATRAQLSCPSYLAVDSNEDLYIADYCNGAVRRVVNGMISTVAATVGSHPLAVTVDSLNDLYYIDDSRATPAGNVDVLRKLSIGGTVSTIATLNNTGCEAGLAIDSQDNLYTADYCLQNLYEITSGGAVSVIAGTGSPGGFSPDGTLAASARLAAPSDVALDANGVVYFTDFGNSRVRKFSVDGTLMTLVGNGNGDGGAAIDAPFEHLQAGIAVDWQGNVYVGDDSRLRKISASGAISTTAGSSAHGAGGDGIDEQDAVFTAIGGIALEATTGSEYIADSHNNRIRHVDASGVVSTIAGTGGVGYTGNGGSALDATLYRPSAVAVDPAGNIYLGGVCQGGFSCLEATPNPQDLSVIRKIDASGIITAVAGNGISGFGGDDGAATSASLNHPLSFTADGSGNLYIADTYNHRVRKVDASGTITTVAGNGVAGFSGDGGSAPSASLNYPQDLAIDSFGTLYIADTGNNRIRKVTAAGVISTFAGTGVASFGGDGGLAVNAGLNGPTRLALAPSGSPLYVVDAGNYRIRSIQSEIATPEFSVAAGTYAPAQSVRITDATAGAAIYYTTNGTTPTTASSKYLEPITVNVSETIKAVAVASNHTESAVASAKYIIEQTATPLFAPAAGTYATEQKVTLTDATPGATIYYTTNGATPTTASTKYSAAITVSATETIKAIAVATGSLPSAIASVTYTIEKPATLTQLQEQIFGPLCSGCHNGAGSSLPGVQNLTSAAATYKSLVNVASIEQPTVLLVKPGNPATSYLIQKLEGTPGITGVRMPDRGPYLSQATIDQIESWITAGAPND